MDTTNARDLELLDLLCGPNHSLADRPLAELFGMRKPPAREFCVNESAPADYQMNPIIAAAKELYLRALTQTMSMPEMAYMTLANARALLCGRIGDLEHEEFWCLWLNSQHQLIKAESVFTGTITQTAVYPREIVKRALALNADSVIFSHNHPSGNLHYSPADERLTNSLKAALELVDVKTLDHIIVSGAQWLSIAQKGLL